MLSLSTSGLKTHRDLECIVDNPLKAGKSTNHENSGTKTLPETIEADLSVDLLDLSTSRLGGSTSLVEDGDHGISWVRDDGAENTSDVTRHEGNGKLSTLRVRGFVGGENVLVERLDDLLEGDELDNGVWDLSAPEWGKSLEETVSTLSGINLLETLDGASWEGTFFRGLHFDFEL